MKQDLFLFPCNGNAKEALDAVGNSWNVLGFIDDNAELHGTNCMGYTVFDRTVLSQFQNARVLAVPGAPHSFHLRKEIIDSLGISEERFATIIHPNANIGNEVKIGRNCLIQAGVVLTSNAEIQDHVVVLPNSVVHHDTQVGSYVMIGSNVTIAGNVRIGSKCYIGSGSSIINGIEIGNECLVGMGSVVIRSVISNSKIAGVPAKQL
jgi:sugar O-acyltransferase (sialic acid O-acetyltransferase NeuD family)